MSSDKVYDIVNERILRVLDEAEATGARLPWRQPWSTLGGGDGAPRSIDGWRYRGINRFILATRMLTEGWNDPRFVTFRKAADLGGGVRPGEKGTPVTYFTVLKKAETDEATGKTKVKSIPFLRYTTVFNIEQCAGLKVKAIAKPAPISEPDAVEAAEEVFANMPNAPLVKFGGDRACFIPSMDEVRVPLRAQFATSSGLYETLFHELGHSTGHSSRLTRKHADQPAHFGSEPYAREELVAELCAAFILAEVGLDADEQVENFAGYLASWRAAIKEDPKALVVAAGQAERAANYILGRLDATDYASDEEVAA